jgi:AcrR family transcriptional regulator
MNQMSKQTKRRRVTKEQWLSKALELFTQQGEPGVRIEHLARELGIAKAGFYWHFKDREDLLDQLLDFWAHEYTEVITDNTNLRTLEPADRLLETMQIIHENSLGELDAHFHVWSMKSHSVRRRVRGVMRKRLDYFKSVFIELGFTGDELETRARLLVAYESNESLLFRNRSKAEARKLRVKRWKFLAGLD